MEDHSTSKPVADHGNTAHGACPGCNDLIASLRARVQRSEEEVQRLNGVCKLRENQWRVAEKFKDKYRASLDTAKRALREIAENAVVVEPHATIAARALAEDEKEGK